MRPNNLKRTITKKAPANDEDLFRQALDQFWRDVFMGLHGSFVHSAERAYSKEKSLERVTLDPKKEASANF